MRRSIDFLKSCDKIRAEHRDWDLHQICSAAAKGPAPCFYVSPTVALQKYSRYIKTGKLCVGRKWSVQMYRDIFYRYDELTHNKDMSSYSKQFVEMYKVVNGEAPCYYLDDSTAFDFYYRSMRKIRGLHKK